MTSITAIAASGMRAADVALRSSAHNLANLQTEGFRREQVVQTAQPDGGVSASTVRSRIEGAALEDDMVAQSQARNSFLANLAVFRAGAGGTGSLLDVFARSKGTELLTAQLLKGPKGYACQYPNTHPCSGLAAHATGKPLIDQTTKRLFCRK
jgi:flagellar hook-associated protein FlgK